LKVGFIVNLYSVKYHDANARGNLAGEVSRQVKVKKRLPKLMRQALSKQGLKMIKEPT
jgi:hypothetical protein